MNSRWVKYAGSVALAAVLAGAAEAQLGGPVGRKSVTAATTGRAFENLFVGFQPYVRFKQGSFLNAEGSMFWAEKYFPQQKGSAISVGGWFVFEGLDNAWQVHTKYYPGKSLGFQVAVLGGTNPQTSGKYDHSLFAIYEIPLADKLQQNKMGLTYELGVGLGAYGYSASGDGYEPSGFIQARVNWRTGFAIDASYWVVEGPSGQPGIERLGIGISYRF